TSIVAGPNNLLLFYMRSTGTAAVLSMGNDGIGRQLTSLQWTPGWSYIAVDTETGVTILYNETIETIEFGRINPDGSFTDIKVVTTPDPKPTDSRWSQFVPVGSSEWFWYVSANGNGLTTTMNPDGT